MRPVVTVSNGFAEREPWGGSFGFEGLTEFQKARSVFWNAIEAGVFDVAFAINDCIADHAKWHSDPLVIAGAIALGQVVPTTIFVTQVGRDISDVDELVGILMRIVKPANDDVWAAADVRSNSRFGSNIFPAFVIDTNFDTGFFSEFFGVDHPLIFIALDKALPAQDPELCALFGDWFKGRGRLCLGQGFGGQTADAECGGAQGSSGCQASAALKKLAAAAALVIDLAHENPPCVWVFERH